MADHDGRTLDEKLNALTVEQNRYTRRIERVLPEIEDAFAKGVSRETVLKTLQEDGINITMSGFAKTLYRLRKKHRGAALTVSPSTRATDTTHETAAVAAGVVVGDRAVPHPPPVVRSTSAALGDMTLRDIARNRPNLAELARLGREAVAKKKAKA